MARVEGAVATLAGVLCLIGEQPMQLQDSTISFFNMKSGHARSSIQTEHIAEHSTPSRAP